MEIYFSEIPEILISPEDETLDSIIIRNTKTTIILIGKYTIDILELSGTECKIRIIDNFK